jgi:hypothetical protein
MAETADHRRRADSRLGGTRWRLAATTGGDRADSRLGGTRWRLAATTGGELGRRTRTKRAAASEMDFTLRATARERIPARKGGPHPRCGRRSQTQPRCQT